MTRRRLLLLLALLLSLAGLCPLRRSAPTATAQPTPPWPRPCFDWPLTPADSAPLDPDAAWQTWPTIYPFGRAAFAPDGALWVPTSQGALRWDLQRDGYTLLTPGAGQTRPSISALAPAPDGAVWLAHAAGVTRVYGAVQTHFTSDDGLPAAQVSAVAWAADTVWAGTENGLARLAGGRWERVPVAGVDDRPVNLLLTGPDGLLWLQSPDGIFSYDATAGRWAWPSGEAPLPGPTEDTTPTGTLLGVDPQGRPWVNVPYGQTYRLEEDAWVVAYPSDGSRFACGVAFAEEQTVYLATCYDGGQGLLRQTAPGGRVDTGRSAAIFQRRAKRDQRA